MKIKIEAETEGDYEQITTLHTLAFNRDAEARLVEKLRRTPIYIRELSLVARYRNTVIGHILFYPIKINSCRKKCVSLALAPISVIPRFQNRKVGTRLIREGLEKARNLGFKSVIVVGTLNIIQNSDLRKPANTEFRHHSKSPTTLSSQSS